MNEQLDVTRALAGRTLVVFGGSGFLGKVWLSLVLDRFPGARYWGENQTYPNCTPIWANRPDVGIANYVRQLLAVQEGNTNQHVNTVNGD